MSKSCFRPTWAEINLENLRNNVRAVARLIGPETGIMAVVKADGYGIGAVVAARASLQSPKVKGLAVATADEAIHLRDQGIEAPILVLQPVGIDSLVELKRRGVSVTVASVRGLREAGAAARNGGPKLQIHLKIDTGMGRVGLTPGDQADAALGMIPRMNNICVEGVFTHFSCAGEDADFTRQQLKSFRDVLERFARAGIRPTYRHAANSDAIMKIPESHFDLVRPGIMLYNGYPDAFQAERIGLLPVVSLFSRVSQVKRVPAGAPVSYGRSYIAAKETTIATVPVGYADGMPRALSGVGVALCRGKRMPIAGRVCMDQFMFDAGDVPVEEGDLVTLMGSDGDNTITLAEIANLSNTIVNDILVGLKARIPRVYV